MISRDFKNKNLIRIQEGDEIKIKNKFVPSVALGTNGAPASRSHKYQHVGLKIGMKVRSEIKRGTQKSEMHPRIGTDARRHRPPERRKGFPCSAA